MRLAQQHDTLVPAFHHAPCGHAETSARSVPGRHRHDIRADDPASGSAQAGEVMTARAEPEASRCRIPDQGSATGADPATEGMPLAAPERVPDAAARALRLIVFDGRSAGLCRTRARAECTRNGESHRRMPFVTPAVPPTVKARR